MRDEQGPSAVEEPVISIGVLASRVGLSVSAVRKYEHEGLLIAHRTPGGRRLFCFEDVARIRHIHHLVQDLGLTLEGIRRLLALVPCWDLRPCTAAERAACPAHGTGSRPCWAVRGQRGARQGNRCRTCTVYRCGSMCADAIKDLVYRREGPEDAGPAIAALLERRRHLRSTEN